MCTEEPEAPETVRVVVPEGLMDEECSEVPGVAILECVAETDPFADEECDRLLDTIPEEWVWPL